MTLTQAISAFDKTYHLSDVTKVISEFKALLLARGHAVSESDADFARLITAGFMTDVRLDNPVVFAAECGFGKSTLLELFLRHKTESDDRFGAIVVKQKREEVEALTNAINRNLSCDGSERVRYKRAFAIRGYDPTKMTYKRYRRQFRHQAYYPVIVMTAEMFARQSSMRLLDRFSSFYDVNGKRRPRRLLLIDERPVITRAYQLSVDDVNRLISDVRDVSHQRHGSSAGYYREFLEYAQELRHILETCEKKQRIEPIDFDYELPDELRKDWCDIYEGDDFDALSSFEGAIRFGGLVALRFGTPYLSVVQRVYYEWTQYNPFILDATAPTDPYYKAYDFDIIAQPEPHRYDNVVFNICDTENLSKSFFDNNPDSLSIAAETVKEIANKHEKTMVVVYKDYYHEMESLLAEEIEAGKIMMKYFDSGRATNEYRECDAAVFLGWLLKGEAYYPQVASAIHDTLLRYDVRIERTGLHFEDERVEAFKAGELVTERIQDVHRIRPRTTTRSVNIYLFHRDDDITSKVAGSFPGARQVEFIPTRRLSGRRTHADNFIDYLRDMEPGERVKSKEIYESLGISRNGFANVQKEPRVIRAMREYGVIKDKTFFVKVRSDKQSHEAC